MLSIALVWASVWVEAISESLAGLFAQVQALIASQHSDGGARDGFYVTL